MCGIVGYVGPKAATPILIGGLRKLEYRGYDSAGLAVTDGKAHAGRALPRQAAELEEQLDARAAAGQRRHRPHALGHARPPVRRERPPAQGRADRGRPQRHHREPPRAARASSRPRAASSRPRPTPRSSRTSSTRRCSPARRRWSTAVRRRSRRCEGAYALVVVSDKHPGHDRRREERVAAGARPRRGREASSPPTSRRSSEHTREVIFLEDGEIAVLTRDGRRRSTDLDGKPRRPRAEDHRLVAVAGREGRLQALHAQGDPRAAARDRGHAARPPRSRDATTSTSTAFELDVEEPASASCFLACGTSYHAALVGEFLDRGARAHPVRGRARERVPLPRSDRRPGRPGRRDQPVGRDADTLAAVKEAQEQGRAASSRSPTWSTPRSRASPTARSTRTPVPRSASRRPRLHHAARRRWCCSRSTSAAARGTLTPERAARAARRARRLPHKMRDVCEGGAHIGRRSRAATATRATSCSSAAAAATRSRSRARSSSRRSRTSTPRATPPAR